MFTSFILGSLVAMSSMSPVNLSACSVQWNPVTVTSADNTPTPSFDYFDVHVTFANTLERTVSRVEFTLDDGSKIADSGTFSTGATVDHYLNIGFTKAASCRVSGVTFADGSTWKQN
jgi:hypothetical protein